MVKALMNVTKYYPIVCGVILTIHCLLLLCGIDLFAVKSFVLANGISFVFFYYLSRLFSFCWLHRLFIIYDVTLFLCVLAQNDNFFAEHNMNVTIARLVMLGFGIIIQLMLLVNIVYGKRKGRTDKCCKGD